MPKPTPAKPKVALPPNRPPPPWFMPFWLDGRNWFWDAQRRRYVIGLDHHVVQVVARRKIDWTWRIERLDTGVVTVGGFGFQIARDARREALAVFWSDLWTGGSEHEQWRNGNLQRFRQRYVQSEACRPAVVATRLQWAAEIEAAGRTAASG